MKSTGKSSKPIIAARSTKQNGNEPAPPDAKSTGKRRVSRVAGDGMRTQVLERISDGILAFDAQMNHVYVDERAGELLGREPKTLVGRNFWEEYPNSTGTPFADACQRAFETQTVVPFDGYFAPTNSWFEGRVYPSTDGLSVLISDRGLPEQEEMIHALEKSEEKFSKAFHSSPIAKAIIRTHDRYIIDINQSFLRLFEFEDREVIGKTLPELGLNIAPAWREVLTHAWKQKGNIQQQEMNLEIHLGEVRHILLSVEPVELDKEACLLVSAMDITERKQAEERIREISEFPLQNPNPIMRFSRGGELMFANPAAARLITLWKQPHGTLALPNNVQEALDKTARTQANTQIEIDDEQKNYICLFVPVPNADYVNLYFSDITERKQAQNSLQALIHQTTTGITRIDLEGRYLFVNQAFCDLIGYSASELMNKSIWDINHPDDMAKNKRLFERMVNEGEPYHVEKRFIRRNGHLLWVNVGTSPLRDARGQVYAAVSVIVDITRRKRAEESLLDGARRTLYLSTLSDTLRQLTTPLQIETEAPVILGAQLKASRVAYARISPDGTATVRGNHVNGMPDMPKEFSIDRYIPRDALPKLHAGKTFVTSGRDAPPKTSQRDDPVHAQVVVPLVREGGLVAAVFIQQTEERLWKPEEIHLAEETAERIQSAIERARTERDRRESERRFRILANTVPSMVWSTEPNGRLLYLNERWYAYTGLSEEESISNWAKLTVHPDDYECCIETWDHSLNTGENYLLELRYRRHDGEYRWFQSHAIPVRDEDGNITAWHGVSTDIHERVQKETELQEIINQTPFMLTRCTRDLHYRFVSRAYAEMIGRLPEEVAGKPIAEIMGESGLRAILPHVEQVLTGKRVEYEADVPFEGVGTRSLHAIYMPDINEEGEVVGWFASITDVSERKRMSEQLERSHQRLNEILMSIQDDLYVLDRDWKFVFASRSFTSKIGREPKDLIGRNIWEMFPKHIGTTFEENFRAAMETREVRRFEISDKYTNAWYRITAFPSSEGITVLGTDITERKRIEDALQLENERFMQFVNSNIIGIVIGKANGKVLLANDYYLNLIGVSREDFLEGKLDWKKVTPSDWLSADENAIRELKERGIAEPYEKEYVRSDGTRIPVYIANARLLGSEDEIAAFVLDITDRKQYEKTLIEHARRQTALYTLTDALNRTETLQDIYDASLDAIISALQSDRAAILLFDESRVIRYVAWRGLSDEYRRVTQGHSPWSYGEQNPIPIPCDEISTADLSDSLKAALINEGIGSLVFIPIVFQGKLIGKFTVHFNQRHSFRETELYLSLTIARQLASAIDRKQREQALSESQQRLSLTYDHAAIGIVETTPQGTFIGCNEEYCRIIGYSKDEIVKLSIWDVNHEEDQQEEAELYQQLMSGQIPYYRMEKRFVRKDGGLVWCEVVGSSVRDENGKPMYAIGAVFDVTERKRTDEQIRELSQRLTYHVDNSPLAVIEWGSDMRLIRWSGAAERIFGWKAEEVLGKRMEDLHWIYEEDIQQVDSVSGDLQTGADPHRFSSNRNYRKDGSIAHCEWYNSSLLDEAGNLRSILSLVLDVTDRKQAEEQRERSNQKLNEILASIQDDLFVLDRQWNFVYASNSFTSKIGKQPEDLVGRNVWMIMPEYANTDTADNFRAAMEQRKIRRFEVRDNNTDAWYRMTAFPSAEGITVLGTDITERKHAEDELRARTEEVETLMEVSPIGIYVAHDPQCKHISGNPAAYSLVAMPADSYGNISKSAPEEEQPTYRVFRDGVELEPDQMPMQAAARLGVEIEEQAIELRFENGSRRYIYAYAKPLFDSNGRTRGAIAAMLDITERKKNEEALRLDATIMENVPAGVYLVRASDETIIHTNRTFDRLFGYESGEILGKHVSVINAPTDHSPQDMASAIIKTLNEKGSWHGEVNSKRKDGSAFWTYASVISFEHATYGPVWVAARQDISERKRVEEALQQLNTQLETRVLNRTAELQTAYEFLRQSEATARLILESMPDAILVTDKEGRIVYGNTQVESLFGYSPDEVMGKPVETFIPVRYRGAHLDLRASYALQRERRNMGLNRDLYGLRKDNSEFPVDVMLSPISNNTAWDVMITIRDNTQQKNAQEALRANEEKLRRLFEILPVGISFLDNEDRISEMNTALTQILGLSKRELMEGGYKPRRYIRADGTPMQPNEFASSRARAEKKPVYNVETGVIKEDGNIVWTSVSATPVGLADVNIVIATTDITERKKAEDALHKHRERLRTLSRRLVEVQEDERRAIAHELHDRVGQNLAALNLNLNILRSQLSTETLQIIGTRIDDSVSLVNQILTITRNVMADLRSNVLDDYGLELALREYTDKFTQRTGIQVVFDKTGKALPRLDPNIEMTLLRIAQEALTNVSRHAQADLVTITTSVDQAAVYMSIDDNGIGILSWQKANQAGSHGLRIIRERAEAFGGSLQVHSAYKKGTRIEVRIPLGNTGSLKSKTEKRS